MEMRQEGRRRGGRQGLMSEWKIMRDRHCDNPDGKIGMLVSRILRACSHTGRTHPTSERRRCILSGCRAAASSDRCLLNAGGAAGASPTSN